jgi:asparagine synthase (glutamine-hydrolysing)
MLAPLASGLAVNSADRISQQIDQAAGIAVAARFATQQIYRDDCLMIACDAELYNRDELEQLMRGAPEKRENSDTAALMAGLYSRFGLEFVGKLRGLFSLVLWDGAERRLLAAIDGFGVNRLAYYDSGKVVAIATRVDALKQLPGIELHVSPQAIANILNFTSNLGPETIFTEVHRLVPGTILLADARNTQFQKYWDMHYDVRTDSNEEHLSQELESLVESSVKMRCRGEPFSALGAFLSGGTDSSTVVGMMTRAAHGPVKAFSIGFQEQPFNELGYAEIAVRKFGSEHHTYLVGPGDCFEALPHMTRYFDEPFGNSSAIPTYFCARLAAQNGVKVLLAGDGGDELFGGNERYATDKIFELYQRIPRGLRKGLIEPVLAASPINGGLVRRARGYVRRANMPPIERFFSYQFLRTTGLTDIFEAGFLNSLRGYSILDIPARHYSQAAAREHLDRLLYVDVKITLADNDLPKVTCMSELAGIRTRFPFLDQAVAEFSGSMPARLKVKRLEKRYLFKRAFRNLLPIEIIEKKKHGFGIPVALWMKTDRRMRELSHDVLLSARAFERGYFRRDFIEDLFRKHASDDTSYYGDTLWTFLALELWHRQVVDEPARVSA